MLVLTRGKSQVVVVEIGGLKMELTVLDVKGDKVRLGFSAPAIRLKVVLFPEPFGPIRPRISPSATSNATFLTARKPSKLLVSPSTASTSLLG